MKRPTVVLGEKGRKCPKLSLNLKSCIFLIFFFNFIFLNETVKATKKNWNYASFWNPPSILEGGGRIRGWSIFKFCNKNHENNGKKEVSFIFTFPRDFFPGRPVASSVSSYHPVHVLIDNYFHFCHLTLLYFSG